MVQQLDCVGECLPLLGRKLALVADDVGGFRKAIHPIHCSGYVGEAGGATPVGHLAVTDAAVTCAFGKATIRTEEGRFMVSITIFHLVFFWI